MTRRRRIVLTLILAVVLPLATLGGAAFFLLGTEAGARWLFTRLGAVLPGSVEIGGMEGRLRGPLVLRDVAIHTDSMDVHIERARLEWRLRELLARRLDIVSLVAEDVRIERSLPQATQQAKQGPLPDVHFSVNVVVRRARVRDLVVVGPQGDEELRIDSAVLESTARGDTVDLEILEAHGPRFDLLASGWLRPQGEYPLDLRVRWSMRPQTLPAFAGSGRLSGSFEHLQVEHALSEPFGAQADLVVHQPLRDPRFEGSVAVNDFRPQLFYPDLPEAAEATIDGTAALDGSPERFTARGAARAATDEWGLFAADFTLERRPNEVLLERVALHVPGTRAQAVVSGSLFLADKVRFDLAAEWSRLSWPLRGEPVVTSATGSGRVEGTASAYQLALDGTVSGPAIPQGTWHAEGGGDTEGVDIATIRGEVLSGRVRGGGSLEWSPQVEWDFAFDGRGLDPGRVIAGWPGTLRATGRVSGMLTDAGPVVHVAPLAAEGTVRGAPLQAAGAIDYGAETVTLRDIEARWGEGRFAFSGTVGDTLDLAWSAAVPNLGLVLEGLRGAARGEGRVGGTTGAPHVVARFEAQGLAYTQFRADSASGRVDVSLAERGRTNATLEARALQLAGQPVERASLVLDGRRDQHTLRLEARAPAADPPPEDAGEPASRPQPPAARTLRVALRGGLGDDMAWDGTLTEAALADPALGRWTLANPAALALSATSAEAEPICLAGRGARACVGGAWDEGAGWQADARLAQVPLGLLQPWLPPDIALTGTISATAEARADAAGALRASAVVEPFAGTVSYGGQAGERAVFRFESAAARAAVDEEGASLRAGVDLPGRGRARTELRLPGWNTLGLPAPATPVRGSANVHFSDIDFAQAFVPGVTELLGRFDADITFSGTYAHPLVAGTARLQDFGADIPAAGLELRGGRIVARSDGGTALVVNGRIASGPGQLSLEGFIPPAPTARTPIRIVLKGERFLAVDRPDIRVLVTPRLTVAHEGEVLRVEGTVRIPEATIVVDELPADAVQPSADVVFVGDENPSLNEGAPLQIAARVQVILGEEITVRAFGFEGSPSGQLTIVEKPGGEQQAFGTINLTEGTYKAYGQDLTLADGELRFSGPIDNPALDLRAFRRATADPEIVAGVEVTGTAKRPDVRLWSDPPMPQTDQLAYLVLGRPLDDTNESEGSLLANAAASLGVRGGNLLARSLGARFGLDEARIETKGGSYEEAALFVGEYLSPRLYVAYGIGLFQPTNIFRLRYALGSRWTLQAETGEATSADLLYTPNARPLKRDLTEDEETAEVPRVPDEEGTGGAR